MSNAKIEKRFSVRAAQGEEFVLAGRALTYMEISSNELMPGMRERIMPGAFTKSLASGRDCHCFLNHDGKQIPLGRLQNGSLQLKDNSDFLSFRCQLTRGIQAHEDVYAAVAAGLISECSFAFLPNDEDMSEDEYGGEKCMVRNIKSAQLFNVSVVGEPFYGGDATSVSARNASEAWRTEMRRKLDAAVQDKPVKPILPALTPSEVKARLDRLNELAK